MSMIVDIERGFNIAGSIPIIQFPSGVVRVPIAAIQTIAGATVGTIGLCGEAINPGARHWIDARRTGQEHAFHGILNITRGAVEGFFGACALGALGQVFGRSPDPEIVGQEIITSTPTGIAVFAVLSLVPMMIQLMSKNGFNPRIHYDLPGHPAPKNPVVPEPALLLGKI